MSLAETEVDIRGARLMECVLLVETEVCIRLIGFLSLAGCGFRTTPGDMADALTGELPGLRIGEIRTGDLPELRTGDLPELRTGDLHEFRTGDLPPEFRPCGTGDMGDLTVEVGVLTEGRATERATGTGDTLTLFGCTDAFFDWGIGLVDGFEYARF